MNTKRLIDLKALLSFIVLSTTLCFVFSCSSPSTNKASGEAAFTGTIDSFAEQSLSLKGFYGDSLILIDSTTTDAQGNFEFPAVKEENLRHGLYRVELMRDQFFYVLLDGKPVKIKTLYSASPFYNVAADSLIVLQSEENKQLYEFQQLQRRLGVAREWLLQILRLYPRKDPFHAVAEKEYESRYAAMEKFAEAQLKKYPDALASKVVKAYYEAEVPDWELPDPDRNKVVAEHYFDHFDPADSFYLYTDILPDKVAIWFGIHSDGQQGQQANEAAWRTAADELLQRVKDNPENLRFMLNYILKKMEELHYNSVFLYLYEGYVKTNVAECAPTDTTFDWVRETASKLRNILAGTVAPDFEIQAGLPRMHQLKSDYTLILFWASWCPHCTEMMPEIKEVTEAYNKTHGGKKLVTVAVSLDSDEKPWKDFVKANELNSWLHTSELKRWEGTVPRAYNVYATPTMFLLDKDKKIISSPETVDDLKELLQ